MLRATSLRGINVVYRHWQACLTFRKLYFLVQLRLLSAFDGDVKSRITFFERMNSLVILQKSKILKSIFYFKPKALSLQFVSNIEF